MNLIFEIFQYDFMIRAFAAGIIIGVIAPLIGIFLVVRRYSLMADTLAHVSFLGLAVGVFTNIYPFITAIILTVMVSLGVEKLRETKKIAGESVLAIFLSGSLALAIILLSLSQGIGINIQSYLFGSITAITEADLYLIAVFSLIVVIAVGFFYRQLFLISFDEETARIRGVSVSLLNKILIVLAAVTVSLSIRIVGILLIGALMVIPVVTAILYDFGFKKTLVLGIVFSLTSVISGLFISYFFNLASGGTIVVVSLIIFIVSMVINRRK